MHKKICFVTVRRVFYRHHFLEYAIKTDSLPLWYEVVNMIWISRCFQVRLCIESRNEKKERHEKENRRDHFPAMV